ncbi:nucleoside deaminase [Pleionea sp. CnH1-48]|uniref:nucleoside deaminase n=1 Tax=Pleionea sp. CnH1-48 TaxID=2954494 RepID=UPI0020979D8D|nr:nucleoside deaminase [Pleionea sp. CnH1-48]MCO7224223.1 nucleoside deaminase [Pleionea sp. CnH1-48]
MTYTPPSPEELMQQAIDMTYKGMDKGQSPFGCAIWYQGEIIACAHNTVMQTIDATAHAEVNAIRQACQHIGQVHLTGAMVATTCEPCPMCMAALHWAQVDTVYFGATIADADEAGFNELHLSADTLIKVGKSSVRLIGGVKTMDCRQLFQDWLGRDDRKVY